MSLLRRRADTSTRVTSGKDGSCTCKAAGNPAFHYGITEQRLQGFGRPPVVRWEGMDTRLRLKHFKPKQNRNRNKRLLSCHTGYGWEPILNAWGIWGCSKGVCRVNETQHLCAKAVLPFVFVIILPWSKVLDHFLGN